MKDPIVKLYNCREGGDLTFDECQEINKHLAEHDIKSIPEDQQENVYDYLVGALNAGSVNNEYTLRLDALVEKLSSNFMK